MANDLQPKVEFQNAYRIWANGGLGLNITGNVMIDRNHLGEFSNVVLDDSVKDLTFFKEWASAAKENGTLIYMQLNHPGKQSPKFLNKTPVAPSPIGFPPPLSHAFNVPKELGHQEILDIIEKFGLAALKAKESGFDGVQIHGAHGYLVSQFLSSKHNRREDQWGGPLENRMKFVLEIIKSIKLKVGNDFGLAIKLNSADFQKGGFSEEESMEVVKTIDELGLDFIEISGGTYEVNAMMGSRPKKKKGQKESTFQREAYFIDYARKIRTLISTPLMLTGGFRSYNTIKEALESRNVDIIGMGRPFAVFPDLANKLLEASEDFQIEISPKKVGVKSLDKIIPLEITWYTQQIHRLGNNKKTRPKFNVWVSLFKSLVDFGIDGLRRSRT